MERRSCLLKVLSATRRSVLSPLLLLVRFASRDFLRFFSMSLTTGSNIRIKFATGSFRRSASRPPGDATASVGSVMSGRIVKNLRPCICLLRVYPRSYSGFTKLSDHESDACPAQECTTIFVQALPVFSKAAAAVQPTNGSLDDPALWQYNKFPNIAAFDNLDIDLLANLPEGFAKFRALIAAVGI